MFQHVFLEVTSLCAFVFTLLAAERFFTGMNKNMNFQMRSFCEREGTQRASVGFLSTLLCFGLGCERHCTKLSGKRVDVFLLIGASNAELSLFLVRLSCGRVMD